MPDDNIEGSSEETNLFENAPPEEKHFPSPQKAPKPDQSVEEPTPKKNSMTPSRKNRGT